MENDARPVIEQKLSPGERLIWSGQPRLGIRLRAYDAFVIPFSIVWCGLAISIGMAQKSRGITTPKALPFFWLPFVLIGVYLVLGAVHHRCANAQADVYGVTNERIIILCGLFGQRTKALNLRTLTDLSLTERSDGSGTITFGPVPPFSQWFALGGVPSTGQFPSPAFELIDRAKEVYKNAPPGAEGGGGMRITLIRKDELPFT